MQIFTLMLLLFHQDLFAEYSHFSQECIVQYKHIAGYHHGFISPFIYLMLITCFYATSCLSAQLQSQVGESFEEVSLSQFQAPPLLQRKGLVRTNRKRAGWKAICLLKEM